MEDRKTSLLIVDDDAPIRKLLERVALRAGFEVDCAKDGIDALEMLEKKHYAIAIVDLMMPRLSGYDLLQKIGAMKPRPVILVATAMANADVEKVDDTLVRRVIRKPFDVKIVAETLIETARQIDNESATARTVLQVSAEELARSITQESAAQEGNAAQDEKAEGKPAPPDTNRSVH